MEGILPIYKPTNITSYDVIRQVKKLLPKGQKIGHAGTLDPFADGVLLILLGSATKRFEEIQGWKKTYRAVAKLGYQSDTLDSEGKITEIIANHKFSNSQIQEVADKFVGEIEQKVPAYSAAKYKGKALYKYARKGEVVPEKSKKIIIYEIKVISVENTYVEFEVTCGSGTYIRQLSYDIINRLGVESYLDKLTRTQVGEIKIENCLKLTATLDMEALLKQLDDGESEDSPSLRD